MKVRLASIHVPEPLVHATSALSPELVARQLLNGTSIERMPILQRPVPIFEDEAGKQLALVPGCDKLLPWIPGDDMADPTSPGTLGFQDLRAQFRESFGSYECEESDSPIERLRAAGLIPERPHTSLDPNKSSSYTTPGRSPNVTRANMHPNPSSSQPTSTTQSPTPQPTPPAEEEGNESFAAYVEEHAAEMLASTAATTLASALNADSLADLKPSMLLEAASSELIGGLTKFAISKLLGTPPKDTDSTLDWAMALVAPVVAKQVLKSGNMALNFGAEQGPFDGRALRLRDLDDQGNAIASGLATVLIEGKPAARETDPVLGAGVKIKYGAKDVFIGGLHAAKSDLKSSGAGSESEAAKFTKSGASKTLIGGPSTNPQPNIPLELAEQAKAEGCSAEYKGPHNPHDKKPTETGIYRHPDGQYRIWDGIGWSSSLSEQASVPSWDSFFLKPFKELMRVNSDPSWFNRQMVSLGFDGLEKKGHWYLFGGLIDLGSPEFPGAGNGAFWFPPDNIFGIDMSPYYSLHDWIYRPDSPEYDSWYGYFEQLYEVEWPSFVAGIRAHPYNPVAWALQGFYSFATSSAALVSWFDSLTSGFDEMTHPTDVAGERWDREEHWKPFMPDQHFQGEFPDHTPRRPQ